MKLEVFNHPMFGNLPVLIKVGKENFAATVIAKMLGYANPHKAIKKSRWWLNHHQN